MKQFSITSVSRAFEILEHFRTVRRPLALKDVVRDLGHPTSSTADLLKSLSYLGYLTFDGRSRTYFPTPRLGELGDWVANEILVRSYPMDVLKSLQHVTNETVLLGTPNDLEILYLVVLESSHQVRYVVKGMAHRPLVRSGVGWALLSMSPEATVERVWRRSIARGMMSRRDLPLKELRDRIEEVRRTGYVVARDMLNPAAAVVATPVPASYHGRELAIGIGGPAERIEADGRAIASALMREIGRMSAADFRGVGNVVEAPLRA